MLNLIFTFQLISYLPMTSTLDVYCKDVWPLFKWFMLSFIPAGCHCFVISVMFVLHAFMVLNHQKFKSEFESRGFTKTQTKARENVQNLIGVVGGNNLGLTNWPLYLFPVQLPHPVYSHTHTHAHTRTHTPIIYIRSSQSFQSGFHGTLCW